MQLRLHFWSYFDIAHDDVPKTEGRLNKTGTGEVCAGISVM